MPLFHFCIREQRLLQQFVGGARGRGEGLVLCFGLVLEGGVLFFCQL